MEYEGLFSSLAESIKPSFIREILSEALRPGMISFAGGLPNVESFPVKELKSACDWVIDNKGGSAFQYAETNGSFELRKLIRDKYAKTKGINIDPEDILITTGSQQAMDLLSRVLINPGDTIITESPGYLGALQVFGISGAHMLGISLNENGMNPDELEKKIKGKKVKFIYCTPNFQNPTGISYSEEVRKRIAEVAIMNGTLIVEDNPYEDLAFINRERSTFAKYAPENTILLGSFSKSVAPGLRLGWVVAPRPILRKIINLKQASDLHSGSFVQYVLCRYLQNSNSDLRQNTLIKSYLPNKEAMVSSIRKYLGGEVRFTEPEGGMFIWLEWLKNINTDDLFKRCLERNVIFVPGKYFYVGPSAGNTARLSFSCVSQIEIDTGIRTIAEVQDRI